MALPVLLSAMPAAWAASALWSWRSGVVHLVAIHAPSPAHLVEVQEAMRSLGPPVLRAVSVGDTWMLVEGSHRTAAACGLGVRIVIMPLAGDQPLHGLPAWSRDGQPLPEGLPAAHYTADLSTGTEAVAYDVPARRVAMRRWWWPRPVPAWV